MATAFETLVLDCAAHWRSKGLTTTTDCEDDTGQKPSPFVGFIEVMLRSMPPPLQQHLEALPPEGPRDWRPLSEAVAKALAAAR